MGNEKSIASRRESEYEKYKKREQLDLEQWISWFLRVYYKGEIMGLRMNKTAIRLLWSFEKKFHKTCLIELQKQ